MHERCQKCQFLTSRHYGSFWTNAEEGCQAMTDDDVGNCLFL